MKISRYISFDEHFLWLYCAPRLLITSAPTSKIELFASTFCSPLSTSPSPPPPPPPYPTSSGNWISATKDLDAITTQNPDTRLIHSSHLIWQRREVWCFRKANHPWWASTEDKVWCIFFRASSVFHPTLPWELPRGVELAVSGLRSSLRCIPHRLTLWPALNKVTTRWEGPQRLSYHKQSLGTEKRWASVCTLMFNQILTSNQSYGDLPPLCVGPL